jgi:hypothetical protein
MIGPNRLFLPVIVAAVVLVGAGRVGAETYRDAAHHFTLEVPAGWRVMEPGIAAVLRKEFHQELGGDAEFLVGLCPRGTVIPLAPGNMPTPFAFAYFVRSDTAGRTAEQAEQTACEHIPGWSSTWGFVPTTEDGVAYQSLEYDRSRSRAVIRFRLGEPGWQCDGVEFVHVGSEGTLHVVAITRTPEYEKYRPTFEQLDQSFRFDQAYVFTPAAPKPAFQVSWIAIKEWLTGKPGCYIVMAVLLGIALKLHAWEIKRKERKKMQQSNLNRLHRRG